VNSFRQVGSACLAAALIVGIAGCGGSGARPATASARPSSSAAGTKPSSPAAGATPSTPAATSADPLARLSALQIAREALADTKAATSVHLAGTVADSGQMITMSVTTAHSGMQCSGTYSMPGKGTYHLVLLGTTVWEKPDDTTWRAVGVSAAALPRVSGRWILTSTSGPGMSSFAAICSISKLFGAKLPASDPNLYKDPIKALDGKVLSLELVDGPGGWSVYVTDTAHPLITRFDSPQYGSAWSINMTGYGAAVTITAPPASEVITPSQLAG
jgi:hypothetical protein